ncbi:DUF2917 domain-containing protein [Duganella aceris]|uniref:DUF2917 domain-containing protein n=1 Tax=Duganella aceris TaxID=2703883 RepID=A0ABX0FHI7_9BURK|nr:DUF2917 domain-containing protein [Duganella aceris]NGZ83962.1 DUF2917 domain-containing protein [Duganella aceris]
MKPELIAVQQGQAEYRLTENHPLRIAHAAGRRIDCLEGTAWITAYGEHVDFMLRRGESFTIPNDGLMLIDAAGGGVVRVRMPDGGAGQAATPGLMARLMSAAASRLLPTVGFHLRN